MEKIVPPGQRITTKLPVLQYSSIPEIAIESWRLKVTGLVNEPFVFSFGDLLGLPKVKISAPFHCVTGWSNLGLRWGGILFKEFLKRIEPKRGAKFAFFRCYDGYTTNLPLEVLMDEDVILAYELEEKPLPPEHGFPLRLVVPKRYAYKSPKWLGEIEFLEIDRKGYWEMRGYSNSADPFKEERYS